MILIGVSTLVLLLNSVGRAPVAAQSTPDPEPAQVNHTDALSLTWKRSTMWTGDFSGPTDSSGHYWYQSQFDDSAWATTSVPNNGTDGGLSDYYYRAHFTWDGSSPVAIRFASDDGLRIYINDHSLGEWGGGWRFPGCVNISSCLFNNVAADQTVLPAWLTAGDNVIAVDVWNSTSGTFSLDVAVIVGDSVPPAAITDLQSLPGTNATQVILHWTAPGDNGIGSGAASEYDIRYGTARISETNWNNATQLGVEPTPDIPGLGVDWTIPIPLATGATWYFAIKTRDNAGNWSTLSNVPSILDSGFRMSPDGYQFCNGPTNQSCGAGWGLYSSSPADSDYTLDDMRKMFGDVSVCTVPTLGILPCYPRSTAAWWLTELNKRMNSGHCLGMAATSLRFSKDLGAPSPSDLQNGANIAHDLLLNSSSRRHIAYYHVKQWAMPLALNISRHYLNTPAGVLNGLRAALSGSVSNPVILNMQHGLSSGHSITPYAVLELGNGMNAVWVYDNNHPDDGQRYLFIDTAHNTWSYDLGPGLGTWSGNILLTNLGIVPLSELNASQFCPWCILLTNKSETTTDLLTGQLWLNGDGHLLIQDSQERRIGFVAGQFINEVPGAFANATLGGVGTETEPIYSLPLTETYIIKVDGQALTQTANVAVSQFGPGYAMAIDNLRLDPGSYDQLEIASDGQQLTYRAGTAKEISLLLALDRVNDSHEFRINGADVDGGQSVTVTEDLSNTQILFNNKEAKGGQYDLSFKHMTDRAAVWFIHKGIVISPTDTHYIHYGLWDDADILTLEIDHHSDGTIDEPPVVLENQVQHVYLSLMARN